MITIILPVSRKNFLNRVFKSLNELECDPSKVNLLVTVDGTGDVFEKARNLTVASKFNERLCVYGKKAPANVSSMRRRRQRISEIHNTMKGLLRRCDYIFLTEDDTLLPPNALLKMMEGYRFFPEAGFITGVQVGRWGYTSIGVYTANDMITEVRSELSASGLQEIDASGFYCLLTKKSHYIDHDFQPFEDILGPDVQFGLRLAMSGYKNYVDWSVNCTHMTLKGDIDVHNTAIQRITFTKESNGKWSQLVI